VRALSNLGAMYRNGLGVKKNEKKAFGLIQQAADKGFASAEFGLDRSMPTAAGSNKDLPKAVEWHSKAVDRGDAGAMNNLAWLFMNAQDANLLNTPKALDLSLRAASQSQEKVPEYLDTLASAYFDDRHREQALEAQKKASALRAERRNIPSRGQELRRDRRSNQEASRILPSWRIGTSGPDVSPPKPVFTPDPPASDAVGTVVLWVGGLRR
jgi:Sel1 repeat